MDQRLKQFVPSATCLACEGCCRFSEERSSWRPVLTKKEKEDPALGGYQERSGHIQAVRSGDGFFCACFDAPKNACAVYPDRPFDCALYPFLAVELDDGPWLAAHLNCPFIQDSWDTELFSAHVGYLKEYFSRPQTLALLRDNPSLFTDVAACSAEIEKLFPLAL